jgi:hypothetical protein
MEKEPRKIRTADDLLSMSREEQTERAMRILAERIAYHERRQEEERAAREASPGEDTQS